MRPGLLGRWFGRYAEEEGLEDSCDSVHVGRACDALLPLRHRAEEACEVVRWEEEREGMEAAKCEAGGEEWCRCRIPRSVVECQNDFPRPVPFYTRDCPALGDRRSSDAVCPTGGGNESPVTRRLVDEKVEDLRARCEDGGGECGGDLAEGSDEEGPSGRAG